MTEEEWGKIENDVLRFACRNAPDPERQIKDWKETFTNPIANPQFQGARKYAIKDAIANGWVKPRWMDDDKGEVKLKGFVEVDYSGEKMSFAVGQICQFGGKEKSYVRMVGWDEEFCFCIPISYEELKAKIAEAQQ